MEHEGERAVRHRIKSTDIPMRLGERKRKANGEAGGDGSLLLTGSAWSSLLGESLQDFDGVAVEDPDYFAMILRDSGGWGGCQESEEHDKGPRSHHQSQPHEGLNRPSQQRARPFSQPHTPP